MPDQSRSSKQLLDQLAAAIAQTRALPASAARGRILIELDDVAARLKAGESITEAYRGTLFFDVIAIRELDDVAETHRDYLNLLSEIAAALHDMNPPH